jgi:hypothetical protein
MLIVGFSSAADEGFGHPTAYGVIIGGAVLLGVAVVHFLRTKRNAIIPAVSLRLSIYGPSVDPAANVEDTHHNVLCTGLLLQFHDVRMSVAVRKQVAEQ